MKHPVFLYMCLALCMAGCSPKTRYVWSDYDNKLYQHYKSPSEYENFIEQLKEAVDDATASGKVPPGLYAEYGYVLYEKGNNAEAVKYFRMENDKWPESRLLMAKMIKLAESGGKKAKNSDVKPLSPPAGHDAALANIPEQKEVSK